MNDKIRNIFPRFIGFAFLGGGLWLLYKITSVLFTLLATLQKEVVAAILAALTAVGVSVLSLILSKYYERKAEIRKEHRDRKIPIYEEFIRSWFKILLADKVGEKPLSEQQIAKFLIDFTQKLIIWGSDPVVKAFVIFREKLIKEDPKFTPKEGLVLFEKTLYEIRRDLGHKNKNLKTGDILALFINDIRQQIPP
ncbi:MAG: hypothetical protein NTY86_18065 [Deltaproteobacteria bacterium]|nr:hypothetical protein [Deltaproteobacteria bacterium]